MNIGTVVALIKSLAPKVDTEVIEQAVFDWLDAHPEATTTVEDGSITEEKLASDVLLTLSTLEDAVSDLGAKVSTISGWAKGTYDADTGTATDSQNYIRNPAYLGKYKEYDRAECDEGYLMLPRAWNRNTLQYVGTLQSDGTFAVESNYKLVTSFDCRDYPDYVIRIAMRKNPASSSISANDGEHCRYSRNAKYNSYFNIAVKDGIEYGSLHADYGTLRSNYSTYNQYRRSEHICKTDGPVMICFDEMDKDYISSYSIWQYEINNGAIAYRNRITPARDVSNYLYIPGSGIKYFKITITVAQDQYNHEFRPITFYSESDITICKNPNITHYENDKPIIELVYRVCDDVYTSGQLILPPNYSVSGKSVPLHVFCHGTGGMEKWESDMTVLASYSLLEEFEYHAKEGFAVFDCYPWTSKYYKDARQISPYAIPIHEMAYLEGIKYICSRFNVDINNVCVSGLSLGGNMAAWFAHQTLLPIKAVAMMAPTTGWASLRWEEYFLEKNARERLVEILGLSEETGADTFVNTEYGMRSNTVKQFVQDHLDAFAGLAIAAVGTSGTTYQDQYDYVADGVSAMPQWMVDKNLPAIPDVMAEKGIPSMVNHPDLCSYAPVPMKYWQAFDDENVSGHANYTIYQWLKNGGTQVYWRTLANGHGGHGATGYKPEAERTSGTTRLGIAYTNVPVAQVEMIDFFCDCLGR